MCSFGAAWEGFLLPPCECACCLPLVLSWFESSSSCFFLAGGRESSETSRTLRLGAFLRDGTSAILSNGTACDPQMCWTAFFSWRVLLILRAERGKQKNIGSSSARQTPETICGSQSATLVADVCDRSCRRKASLPEQDVVHVHLVDRHAGYMPLSRSVSPVRPRSTALVGWALTLMGQLQTSSPVLFSRVLAYYATTRSVSAHPCSKKN